MENKPRRREIVDFAHFAPKPKGELKSFIDSFFNQELNQLISEEGNYSGLYHRFYSLALDPGLKRDHSLNDEYKAPPVAMFNRQAFLYELRKTAGNKKFTILNIDIAGLRRADLAKTADYNLNIFAKKLNDIVQGIKLDDGQKILIGRYGGDEFSVGLVGDFNKDQLESIKKELLLGLESTQGIFDKDFSKKENFQLKDHKVNQIDIPNEKNRKRIFLSFLKRGLVLDKDQLEKEIKFLSDSKGKLDQKRLNNYLQNVEVGDSVLGKTLEEKITNIVAKHPELKTAFYYADYQDKQAGDLEKSRQNQLLEFVENYLVDPLLGEIAISRFDLFDHLKRGEFNRVLAFELKVKEINDYLNYTYADQVITALWKIHLSPAVNELLKKGKISLGRIGGSIFIDVKDGVEENELINLTEKLKKIKEINVDYKGKAIPHVVGFADIDVGDTKDNDKRAKEKFGQMFTDTNKNYLFNLFEKIFDNEEDFEDFKRILDDSENEITLTDDENIFTFLSARYFNGKRFNERISLARSVFKEFIELSHLKITTVNQIFDKLIPKLTKKYL